MNSALNHPYTCALYDVQVIGHEGLGGFGGNRRTFEIALCPGVRLLQSEVRDEARLDRHVIDRVLRGGP